jgi:hypothetical protein
MIRRASDDERESCLRDLRAAYVHGRLDAGELERRAGRAATASTQIELRRLTADLPRSSAPRWVRAVDRADRALLKGHAASFTVANGGLVGVWAATGQGDFWPAWLLVPWTMVLSWHAGGSWSVRRMLRRRAGSRARHRAVV